MAYRASATNEHRKGGSWIGLLLSLACGDSARESDNMSASVTSELTASTPDGAATYESSGGPDTTTTSGPSGSGGPSGPTTGPSADSATDRGTLFDVPPTPPGDDGVAPTVPCRIDFLFVIDSSCSMENDQDNIDASLAGFVSTIETRFGANDHHIMVVDTDEVSIDQLNTCRSGCAVGLLTTCGATPCAALPPDDGCGNKLGLGLNNDRYGFSCNFLGANRYIIDGQPDLTDTFRCAAADRGDTGLYDERAAGALVAAISPEMNGPGGCNAGFLRHDAILVVTMITDEEDDPNDHNVRTAMDFDFNSAGDPDTWRQAVVDAKYGNEEAVVMLGLLGDPDVATGGTWCPPLVLDEDGENYGVEGAEETHRLRQLSESFTHGMWAGICEPNYAPFFDRAVSVIDTACEAFVPPPE